MTAPAASSRSTASAFALATLFLRSVSPQVVGIPTTSNDSLTVIGRPCKEPQLSPRASAASASSARRRARWKSVTMIALSVGLCRSTRSKKCSSNSRQPISRVRIAAASAVADRKAGSVMIVSCSRSMGNVVYQARPQADDADQDQIDRDDVVQEAWDQQDQNAGDQRDERLDKDDIEGHGAGSSFSAEPALLGMEVNVWTKFSPAAVSAARYATASPPHPSRLSTAIAGCVNGRMVRRSSRG